MTKYCPDCGSEYQNNINICPDDGAILSFTRVAPSLGPTALDIYAAANEFEAERIIAYFIDEGIHAIHEQTSIAQLPSFSDAHFIITVNTNDKERAIQLLNDARSVGIITTSGVFL